MRCIMCGKLITTKEERYRMCMPCELDYLREYKKREEEHIKGLVGGPAWKQVKGAVVHGNGCVLN